jgi:hypothetical protein
MFRLDELLSARVACGVVGRLTNWARGARQRQRRCDRWGGDKFSVDLAVFVWGLGGPPWGSLAVTLDKNIDEVWKRVEMEAEGREHAASEKGHRDGPRGRGAQMRPDNEPGARRAPKHFRGSPLVVLSISYVRSSTSTQCQRGRRQLRQYLYEKKSVRI